MPVVSDNELVKLIRNKQYSNVYYFYGRDVSTIELYVKRLTEKLVGKESSDYNLHKFSGKLINLSDVSDSADALPMFSDNSVILINDFNAEDYTSTDIEFLKSIIINVQETTFIIFYNTGIDIMGGKKFPTPKNKKIIDAVSKIGSVCELDYKKPKDLVKPIIAKVEKAQLTISAKNAELIAELCLSNMVLINNEIDKLISYVVEGEITEFHINQLTSRQLDSNSFALARAVTNNQIKSALSVLDELFTQRNEPIAILSAISLSFIDLYRAKCAITSGKSAQQVMDDFGYKSNRKFAVDNAFRDARKMSIENLRYGVRILALTDIKMKSTQNDGRLLIEEAIIKMSSLKRRENIDSY